jgi:hypothetical protein
MKQSWQLFQSARAAAWQSQHLSQLVGLQNRWREKRLIYHPFNAHTVMQSKSYVLTA